MKLSDYARQIGVTYKTAYLMFKRGELDVYQLPTGTIIVNKPAAPNGVIIVSYLHYSFYCP